MTDEATAETCVQVIDTTLVHTHVQLCSQLVVAPILSPVIALAAQVVTATMRSGALALVLFAHCDRAWSALQPLRSPTADGFRIAYFGYGSNLAASVREGRRGLRPLSCEVGAHDPLTCLPQHACLTLARNPLSRLALSEMRGWRSTCRGFHRSSLPLRRSCQPRATSAMAR